MAQGPGQRQSRRNYRLGRSFAGWPRHCVGL